MGDLSDGYHTFDELYEHRVALFIALMKAYPQLSWWSELHADGSKLDGWVVAGMHLPTGDITYHLSETWVPDYLRGIEHLDTAPEWDGHTPAESLDRLKMFILDECKGEE